MRRTHKIPFPYHVDKWTLDKGNISGLVIIIRKWL